MLLPIVDSEHEVGKIVNRAFMFNLRLHDRKTAITSRPELNQEIRVIRQPISIKAAFLQNPHSPVASEIVLFARFPPERKLQIVGVVVPQESLEHRRKVLRSGVKSLLLAGDEMVVFVRKISAHHAVVRGDGGLEGVVGPHVPVYVLGRDGGVEKSSTG